MADVTNQGVPKSEAQAPRGQDSHGRGRDGNGGGEHDGAPGTEEPVPKSVGAPLRPRERNWLGLYFVGLSVLTFYVLIATWPVVKPSNPGELWRQDGFVDARIFGFLKVRASADSRLLITVVAAGALGSLVHCLTSFGDFVGNRDLKQSWVWFYILRTPIGIALAILFYLVLRGGLIAPTLPESVGQGTSQVPTATLMNPFGLAAVAAMAGMFSKQATDKLGEVFDSLFHTTKSVHRADPLAATKPAIASTEPQSLTVNGDPRLVLIGRNFDEQCAVTVNGKPRETNWESATRVTVTLLGPEDLKDKGELKVIVRNPVNAGGDSVPFAIAVGPAS
jgi:IPT/TIG domain